MPRFNQIEDTININVELKKYNIGFIEEAFLNKAKSLNVLRSQKWRTRLSDQQILTAVDEHVNRIETKSKIRFDSKKYEATEIKKIYSKSYLKLLKKTQKKDLVDVRKKINEAGLFSEKNVGKIVILTDSNGTEHYYTINHNFQAKLNDYLNKGYFESQEINYSKEFGSDVGLVSFINQYGITNIKIVEKEEEPEVKKHHAGEFFKYYCNMDMDLSRYGILKNFDAEYYNDACLIHALKVGGLSEEKLDEIKMKMKNSHLSQKELKTICGNNNIKIILHKKVNSKGKEETGKLVYGDSEEVYNIGLIDEHYFIMEDTKLTKYSIENYESIKNEKNWNKIYNNKNHRKEDRYVNSLNMFCLLLANKDKLLTEIKIDDDMMKTPYYNKISQEIRTLNYNDDSCKLFESENMKNVENDYKLVFFDFETVTKTNNDIHVPYMVCYQIEGQEQIRTITGGENIGHILLARLYDECRDDKICLVAHNMRYDISFISKYMHTINPTEAGGKIIACAGMYKNKKIMVKDSYCVISMGLKKFPECFGIEGVKKEIMNYDMYNDLMNNFWNRQIREYDLSFIADTYYKNDKQEFLENCRKWDVVRAGKVDIMDYAECYCKQDIRILNKGYMKFRQWVLELYNIDIKNIMTISGLADKVLKTYGCYDGCYSFGGVIRKFISESVVGGRTMIKDNEKVMKGNFESLINELNQNKLTEEEEKVLISKHLTENINDFDGVSLYPSSMARIKGFPMGTPKVLNNLTYDFVKDQDYYFVEIEIKKIGVARGFSLVSELNDAGVRMFNNDMINKRITVDKTGLEDLIEFQKVEFEIIKGYYFNEGFNNKINELIVTMFNERLKKKKEGNPIEIVYKLLMNSAYGKTILKEQEVFKKYFNNRIDAFKYMLTNYNNVVEARQLTNDSKYVVKMRKEIDEHFNFCHIGSYILSMSKRIMNEVMCTAEDNGIEIFYQDTDSMHLKDCDIKKLVEVYNQKYNRELIGKNLGQFHSDFNMCNKKAKNIISKGCVFLGKKCYIDVLKSENTDDIETHIRMKGISERSLIYTANKFYKHSSETSRIINLYYDLYNGKKITFDLLCDGEEIKFKTFDLIVKTVTDFKRELKF